MPPIEMLRGAGVLVFAGNDDIRDTWSPYGTGDLLERAAIIGWKGDFRRDHQMEVAFDLISAAGAKGPYSNYDCDCVGEGSTNFEALGAIA